MFDNNFLSDLKNNKHLLNMPKHVIDYVESVKDKFKLIPSIKVKHTETSSLDVVDQLRAFNLNCTEEQYSNIPIIRHDNIVYEGNPYTLFKLPYGCFRISEENEKLIITKLN